MKASLTDCDAVILAGARMEDARAVLDLIYQGRATIKGQKVQKAVDNWARSDSLLHF